MTTTKRYPTDPYRLDEHDFLDSDGETTFTTHVYERCVNCSLELGHTENGFVEVWRDADSDDDAAWCRSCVDEPEVK